MNASAPSAALFERAEGALPGLPSFHRALADETLRSLLETCSEALGYRLIL